MESNEEHRLTPELLARLWTMAKAKEVPDEAGPAVFQKFMVMHEDMHEAWERLEKDPATSLEAGGENLLLHIAMDVATMRSLELNQPGGIAPLFASLVRKGFEQGRAFHVVSQAMYHEFLTAARQGREMDQAKFLARAQDYACRASDRKDRGNS